jgi:SAM-dependent methyltransferase
MTAHGAALSPVRTYGQVARLYEYTLRLSGQAKGIERYLARLPLPLPAGARVMDAGCGTGFLALWLAQRFPEATVTAFDLEPRMLEVLTRSTRRAGIPASRLTIATGDLRQPDRLRRLADGAALPPLTAALDLIVVGAALEHVPLEETLRGLTRLLRPGGLLLNLAMRDGLVTDLLRLVYRFRPYEPEELSGALARAGLNVLRMERLAARNFPANLTRLSILARKP